MEVGNVSLKATHVQRHLTTLTSQRVLFTFIYFINTILGQGKILGTSKGHVDDEDFFYKPTF